MIFFQNLCSLLKAKPIGASYVDITQKIGIKDDLSMSQEHGATENFR